jgi:hypothetical protein
MKDNGNFESTKRNSQIDKGGRLEIALVLTVLSVDPLPAAGVARATIAARSFARPVRAALVVRRGRIRVRRWRIPGCR